MGKPPPLFENVVVRPPDSATKTVKDEMDDVAGMFVLNE
jgi:hypothetical protein